MRNTMSTVVALGKILSDRFAERKHVERVASARLESEEATARDIADSQKLAEGKVTAVLNGGR